MTEPRSPFASVGVCGNYYNIHILTSVARRLKERHGSRLHLYVGSEREVAGFRRRDTEGLWTTISCRRGLLDGVDAPVADEAAVFAAAQAWEARLGENLNTLMLDQRQLGRGYQPLGERYPRNPKLVAASYAQVLRGVVATLDDWDRDLRDKGVTLLLDCPLTAEWVLRAHQGETRLLSFGRHGNLYYWSLGALRRHPPLKAAFDALDDAPDAGLDAGYAAAVAKMSKMHQSARTARTGLAILGNVRSYGVNLLRGRRAPISDIWDGPLRRNAALRRYERLATGTLESLAGRSYVYFPLQKEPETAWAVMSPEFTSQHAALMAASQALPAGTLLAVKENVTALGRRPVGFYDQLLDMKNVVLVGLDEPSIPLQKGALATGTLNGTATLESAIMGKPTFLFGRHMLHTFLDHVLVVRDPADLRPFLARAAAGEIDATKARRDGNRFMAALKQTCFDLGAFILDSQYDTDKVDQVYGETAYAALAESLGLTASRPPEAETAS